MPLLVCGIRLYEDEHFILVLHIFHPYSTLVCVKRIYQLVHGMDDMESNSIYREYSPCAMDFVVGFWDHDNCLRFIRCRRNFPRIYYPPLLLLRFNIIDKFRNGNYYTTRELSLSSTQTKSRSVSKTYNTLLLPHIK